MKLERDRIIREKKTIDKMVEIYCKSKHTSEPECSECRELLDYSHLRLDNCRFENDKPVCARCRIHCYKPDMRERVIKVMRFSGPRMLLYHPILTLRHFIDMIFYSK